MKICRVTLLVYLISILDWDSLSFNEYLFVCMPHVSVTGTGRPWQADSSVVCGGVALQELPSYAAHRIIHKEH